MISDSPRREGFVGVRLRDGARRVLVLGLALSFGVHLLLTPVAAWLGLLAWFFEARPADDDTPAEQLDAIPISLIEAPPVVEEPAPEPPAPGPAPELTPPKPSDPAAPEPAPKRAPEPVELPAKPPARSGPLEHPVSVSGVQSQVLDSNANVSLLLLSDRVRGHPLGERIGRLLVDFPQWQSFLGATGIDPIHDLDRVLVVGPQFRRSADVVVVVRYGIETEAMQKAIDRLVHREPRGSWASTKPMMARAYADRAERVFAFSGPKILVIAPPHLEAQLRDASITRFPEPASDDALVINIKTPWRALIGLPFTLPQSLSWLRLSVLPLADGGAYVRVEAEDADAKTARDNALALSRAVNAITNPELGAFGALLGVRSLSFLDPISLRANGGRLAGEVHVRPAQLARLLGYAEELVRQWTGRRAPASGPTTQRGSGAPTRAAPAAPGTKARGASPSVDGTAEPQRPRPPAPSRPPTAPAPSVAPDGDRSRAPEGSRERELGGRAIPAPPPRP